MNKHPAHRMRRRAALSISITSVLLLGFILCLAPAVLSGGPAFSAVKPALSEEEPDSTLAKLRRQAIALRPLLRSSLAIEMLAAVPALPAVSAPRRIYYRRDPRAALNATEWQGLSSDERQTWQHKDFDAAYYYFTRYGTPLASLRAFDLVGQAGLTQARGAKVLEFGFGSIGQLRLLASLGAEVHGIEVDPVLRALYSQPNDTGRIQPAPSSPHGIPGYLQLHFGRFPAEAPLVREVGQDYDLFIAKNTLKRGYIHPAREVDPRMLIQLGVDDSIFVRRLYLILKPGGFAIIYNLSPAPAKDDEDYIPWADGRCPFDRELLERVGFSVLAYDKDDSEFARRMGRALGWAEAMDLENDLFGTLTLLRR